MIIGTLQFIAEKTTLPVSVLAIHRTHAGSFEVRSNDCTLSEGINRLEAIKNLKAIYTSKTWELKFLTDFFL